MTTRWRTLLSFVLAPLALALYGYVFWGFGERSVEKAVLVGRTENATLNAHILRVAASYPTDGTYKVLPASMRSTSFGTTKDIHYGGRRVITGDPERRSYCSGLMLEVYMQACAEAAGPSFRLAGLDTNGFYAFRRDFYGYDGNRRTLVNALVSRGLAREIKGLELAQPGDMIQFWRHSGTGHSAVYIGHQLRADGTGDLEFWSVHSGLGISIKSEPIGTGSGCIDKDQVFIARALQPTS